MDYSGLKPGIHLYQGQKRLKSLSLTDADEWANIWGFGESRTQSVEALFASVSWVHIALIHRGNMIGEIPVGWERNGEAVEIPPINFDLGMELLRIDQSLELRAVAYLLKQRAGARVNGLRWLDPTAITPDPNSLTVEGYQVYKYNTAGGERDLPAEDVLRIMLPGQREHDPAPAASTASSLASQLLLGMEETADTFFDTNGLPVIAVIVPAATSPDMVEQAQNRFRRIFQRRRTLDGNKTIGLREGTKIETISFAPKDLAMPELEKGKVDAVLLAHGVPPSLVYKDVNRAEAELKMLQFVGTIAGRLKLVTNAINEDEDIARLGYELAVYKERHEIVQQWELAKAQALQLLTGRPVLTVNEARERLELEPLQESDIQPAPEAEPQDDMKTGEIVKLRRYARNGKHLERPFKSDILTPLEIQAVILEEAGVAGDAPFWQGYP